MNYMDRIHRSYRESEFNTAPIERKLDFFEMDWNDAHRENEEFNIRYPKEQPTHGMCTTCHTEHWFPT